jgi:hypothetical protein
VAALERQRLDAEGARETVTEARRAAEQAGAARYKLFASAQTKERDGRAAFGRSDYSRAGRLFQDAQADYQSASKEAEGAKIAAVQQTEQARSQAEQMRSQMTAARRGAEQAGADRYASKLLASAHTKERDGQSAFGRSDYDSAGRLFREAHSDYQSATQEAKREADVEQRQVATLKAAAEQMRGRTVNRRDQAVKAEANRLAKDLFDVAQAKQAEAEGLAGRQNFAAASQAYQDATDRYLEAILRTQVVREARAHADSAKARMLAEKQRARQDSPDFKAALAEEKQATSLYEQLAYKEAAERFRAAELLFAKGDAMRATPAPSTKAPEVPPAPSRPTPRRSTPAPF